MLFKENSSFKLSKIFKSEEGYTRFSLLWMNFAAEPLVALYSLFPFILRKDLHASALQVSIFLSLKPTLAVLAYYWNAYHTKKGKNILSNLVCSWALAYIPFLIYPLLHHYWYFIFAAGFYQLFSKAVTPPLMELLKRNVPKKPRESAFSWSYLLCVIEGSLIGVVMGVILDQDGSSWKWLSLIFALIALSSILIQRKIPCQHQVAAAIPVEVSPSNPVVDPLKESFKLMKSNPDFKNFQMGFMIGGSALMLMGPALSLFYADTLQLTHEGISNARFLFMTIGVIGSSFLWRKSLEKMSLNQIMPLITIGFGLFPLLVLAAYLSPVYLNLAFLMYGIAQAGSHLIWHLSGTVFSQDKNSTPFTAVNILLQGLRGMVAPLLGGVLCTFFGPIHVLILGSLLCFWGVWVMLRFALKNPLKGVS